MDSRAEAGIGATTIRWADLLRGHGLRATPQRVLLLDRIAATPHATIERLHELTEDLGVALTTVYRTVDTLEDAGLLWPVTADHRTRIYHLADDGPHAHTLCRTCGTVTDIPHRQAGGLADTTGRIRIPHFTADRVQVLVLGTCSSCTALVQAPDPSP